MFAASALDCGFPLAALLPFKTADYETTFGDATTVADYHALLRKAASVTELPGTLADQNLAYEAVGHAMVAQANVLIAVWDGMPSAGRGGTPEIIEHAVLAEKPVIWIDAAMFRLPRLIFQRQTQLTKSMPLHKLAARAEPLTKRKTADLARRF